MKTNTDITNYVQIKMPIPQFYFDILFQYANKKAKEDGRWDGKYN